MIKQFIYAAIFAFAAILLSTSSYAGLDDIFKKAKEIVEEKKGLSQGDIVQGLKEALSVGAANAVKATGRENGFYKHPDIRIPLPNQVTKVETLLRNAGYGSKIDEFEISMNRAAERATPGAKSIFIDAITHISFTDASKILKGRDNEATLYFKEKTSNSLSLLFRPVVHTAMNEVGVTRLFQNLNDKLGKLPFAEKITFDLDAYVTGKALDGLFFIMAQEEKKIRKDPRARVTDILKKVFKDTH